VAEPFPLSVKVTPVGRAPVSDRAGVGSPVAVTLKDPAWPAAKVLAAAEVMVGATSAWITVRVKDWVAPAPTPLAAPMLSGYVPAVPAPGVPARVAVPLWLSVKVTPVGRAPVSDSAACG
jgi:hypothetical protein